MKIFVTESSGFIGKELVESLAKKHEIVKYDLVNGQDILDYDKLKNAMKGCQIVVHLAAIPRPVEEKTFSDYFHTNCHGTFNVAQAAKENNVKRLVFTSSTTYYGIEKGIPFIIPIKESNPVLTQHVKVKDLACRDCDISYSTSKVIAEQILANYGMAKKFEVIILRIGPTRPSGQFKPFLGTHLKIENAVKALEAAIDVKEQLWYEAFTITDELENIDISKAKKILNYKPIK
ncbi:MAG: NAD(P)-dependent oxidoreductase [archaeon]|nr:NAD(P)-dependent oxidoreductase [archaeon]